MEPRFKLLAPSPAKRRSVGADNGVGWGVGKAQGVFCREEFARGRYLLLNTLSAFLPVFVALLQALTVSVFAASVWATVSKWRPRLPEELKGPLGYFSSCGCRHATWPSKQAIAAKRDEVSTFHASETLERGKHPLAALTNAGS